MLGTIVLLLSVQAATIPVATSVEPSTIEPYRSVELVINGEGFDDECRVLLGVPGKMVPFRSQFVDSGEIRVRMTSGLGPKPVSRRIVVDCGRGRRSDMLALTVARVPIQADDEPVEKPPAIDLGEETSPPSVGEAPRIISLEPSSVNAGEPLTLTLMGENFREGATVEVFSNANAGTSREPDYRAVPFAAEVASDTVLLVDFDRGFAPSPKRRSVAVVNTDGTRSPPLYLGITRRLP